MIEVYKQYALRDLSLEPETEARSRSLPPAEVCEKLLRYEAHIERQLSRKMAQLERLQRRRLGDDVPPPMSFNFGVQ